MIKNDYDLEDGYGRPGFLTDRRHTKKSKSNSKTHRSSARKFKPAIEVIQGKGKPKGSNVYRESSWEGATLRRKSSSKRAYSKPKKRAKKAPKMSSDNMSTNFSSQIGVAKAQNFNKSKKRKKKINLGISKSSKEHDPSIVESIK